MFDSSHKALIKNNDFEVCDEQYYETKVYILWVGVISVYVSSCLSSTFNRLAWLAVSGLLTLASFWSKMPRPPSPPRLILKETRCKDINNNNYCKIRIVMSSRLSDEFQFTKLTMLICWLDGSSDFHLTFAMATTMDTSQECLPLIDWLLKNS